MIDFEYGVIIMSYVYTISRSVDQITFILVWGIYLGFVGYKVVDCFFCVG